MELGQIKIDLDKLLDKKHEDSVNLIDFEVELEYNGIIVVFELDSEMETDSHIKRVYINNAFIQFPDFEAEFPKKYIKEIEQYLKL